MKDKNILLGYGERLTSQIPLKGSGGEKSHPYSYSENKKFVIGKLQKLLLKIDEIPDKALFEEKAVVKLILHPAYLAKSYYPDKLINQFSLQTLGSRGIRVNPRKQTLKKKKTDLLSVCLYLSGTKDNYGGFLESLESGSVNKSVRGDIIKIEDLDIFEPIEKIKNIKESVSKSLLEVALHSPSGNERVVASFKKYAEFCGASIDIQKLISVDGLTFLPVSADSKSAKKLANFSYLRSVKDSPAIRIHNPVIQRQSITSEKIQRPTEPAFNSDIKVAVFDGGLGIKDFDVWCNETTFNGGQPTSGNFLSHGQQVTSTVLFGNIDASQTNLPQPYSKIDHYRVIDDNSTDIFDALIRIKSVLDKEKYSFINLSLGPQLPIEDDDVNVWTSTIEKYLSDGLTLCTVAVGNDGDLDDGLNRIQPPSDMINALSIGASTSSNSDWQRCDYSCIGPGRSPGFMKPDGLLFGGTEENPFVVYDPMHNNYIGTAGTSFSAPLALRQAIGIYATLKNITPLTTKALLIHHSENIKKHDKSQVGHGLLPHGINQVIYCDDNEVKVIYQGSLEPSKCIRALIPFPDQGVINGRVTLKATFCFASQTDPQHPINYTRSGLSVIFRHKFGESEEPTKSFFNLENSYPTEHEQRFGAHKWETTLHREQTFNKGTLNSPCFDIVYQAREDGKAADIDNLEPLPYVLIVSIKVKDSPEIYNNIRQKYKTLAPIQLEQRVVVK